MPRVGSTPAGCGLVAGAVAVSVVIDTQLDLLVAHVHRDGGVSPAGVADHVGERLLHDAVCRQRDAGRHGVE